MPSVSLLKNLQKFEVYCLVSTVEDSVQKRRVNTLKRLSSRDFHTDSKIHDGPIRTTMEVHQELKNQAQNTSLFTNILLLF